MKKNEISKKTKTIYNVEWDTDGIDKDELDLPDKVEVPSDIDDDQIPDWLSDRYGFCVNGWEEVIYHMELEEIRQRINELAKEKEMMENALKEAMVNIIYEVAKENHYGVKKIGGHMCSISLSQMSGKPWSPQYYDWEDSAKSILNHLSGTPAINWKKKLMRLLETKGDVVEIKKRGMIWPGYTTIVERIPIEKVFIEKIIERI